VLAGKNANVKGQNLTQTTKYQCGKLQVKAPGQPESRM